MFDIDKLLFINKEDLKEEFKLFSIDDLTQLIGLLAEKDDKIRYQALQLLQHRSSFNNDVYPFWDTFCQKLKSENSYQRSIGLMLIAENVKWDKDDRIIEAIDDYLSMLNDEKPITVRQCIQALCNIVPYKSHLHKKIADKLMSIRISDVKDTMRKLILLDIITVLVLINKYSASDEINEYIFNALSGGILDKKSIKKIEAMLK